MALSNKEKIREIYEVLPKVNCGLCGFETCGQFARAVAEKRVSPFACRRSPWAGYKISEIIEAGVPAHRYRFQPAFVSGLGAGSSTASLKSLREEVKGLSRGVDDILARIENLKARRRSGYYH